MNSSTFCLSEEQLRLSGSSLESVLYTTLFPPICLFGLIGNALTITVLVNNDFMSRANVFLACLAVCDVSFLILIIPHSLANFDTFAFNYTFRSLYLPSKIHLIAFANWTSAVAIWLVVCVCFERVCGVRSPLHRLTTPSRMKLVSGLAIILILCAIVTFYNHFSHHCFIKTFCNTTQIMAVCVDVNLNVWPGNRPNLSPPLLRQYVSITRAANAVLVVFLPLIFLIVLNIMLMYYVKKRSFFMYASLGKVSARMRKSGDVALPFVATLFRRHSDQMVQQKTEHRVAVTVCAVVTSFTITQAPSAVVLTINSLWLENFNNSRWWYLMTTIISFLVVIGKSSNFVVFCLSSSSFRRRLFNILRTKYGSRGEKRSYSINTTYTRCDSRDSRILSQKKSFQSI